MSKKDHKSIQRSNLSAAKQTLLQKRIRGEGASSSTQSIPRRLEQKPASLSSTQKGLWFLSQLEPDSSFYNIFAAVQLKGLLNVIALEQSLNEILRRHEALRTTFTTIDGQPVQVIAPALPLKLSVVDLRELSEVKQATETQRLASQECQQPFDLSCSPLLRTALLHLGNADHMLLLTMHHIASDGWSLGVFIRELAALYEAFCVGKPSPLPELPIQYVDFAVWQRQWLQGEVTQTQLAYWKKQLGDRLPVLELPTDRPRPPVQTFRGARHSLEISKSLTERLKLLSQQEEETLFMTLLAAFQVLLYRYTGQEDILVGSPIANRIAETESLIGLFVNTLVMSTNLSGNFSFRELLKQVKKMALAAYAHQDLPFEQLVEALQPTRDLSHNPLFQVMFVLQNAPMPALELPGLTLKLLDVDNRTSQFDITLNLREQAEGLSGWFEYNTDLFDTTTIARMAKHFQNLLEDIVTNPEQSLLDLSLLTPSEQQQLLMRWDNPLTNYSLDQLDQCIHQLFEVQVEQTPNAVAVVFEDKHLTYQELNTRANQVAHHLQQLGVRPEVRVGLCLERSLEMVVGMLGILKAAGAYVPFDPAYPSERLTFLLKDSNVSVLLTQQHLIKNLPEQRAPVVCLDTDWEVISQQSKANTSSRVTSKNLAYVIYTSGSTGTPKGVLVNHINVVRLFTTTQSWFNFDERDVWTNFHSYAFDFSVWEIWGALLYGGKLVVVPQCVTHSPDLFWNLLYTKQVTVLNQIPSAFRQLIQAEQTSSPHKALALRWIIFGGEALDLQSLKPWFDRYGDQSPQLVNMYGITETTVHVTYRLITIADLTKAPGSLIGGCIPDLQIYLFNQKLQPVPVGLPGEMYIGGAGLARGYLNRPELVAERFIPHPFSHEPGARLYKTGDLARYLTNGDIKYLGRIDHQVKIRGFRIELGEIETALRHHPDVEEATVVIREENKSEKRSLNDLGTDQESASTVSELRRFIKGKLFNFDAKSVDKRLVAYCVCHPKSTPTTTELRRFLKGKLPDYMIPSAFVVLNTLPLTPSGKIDQRSLPAPNEARPALEEAFVAPQTPLEETLAQIWTQVLGVTPVGIHDNFFELGGDSIRSIQVQAKAQERGLNFSIQQLFRHQTIHELVQFVSLAEPSSLPTVKTEAFSLISDEDRQKLPSNIEDAYPLARIQAGIIFHCQCCPGTPLYHDILFYHLRLSLDIQCFQMAVQQLVARHAILRTSFDLTNFTEPLQLVHKTVEVPVQIEDWRSLSPDQQSEAQTSWMEEEKSRHFDWTRPPLARFYIHRLTDDSFHLIPCFHDSILDGWSTASLLTELLHRYCCLLNGETPPTESPPTVKYRDFVALERRNIESTECQHFWKQNLSNCVVTTLPRWTPCLDATHTPQIAVQDVPISPELSDELKKLALLAGVPLKHVLLAAHLKVMSLLSGQPDVLTGLESNGRLEEADGEQTIGMHLNTVPFRLKLSEGTWINLIQETFKAELDLLPFRRYPLAELQKGRSGQPLIETVFNYTHFHVFENLQKFKGLEILGARGFEQTHFTLRSEFSQNPLSKRTQLDLVCNVAQISHEQLGNLSSYYAETLTAMTSEPYKRHETVCLLPLQEQHQQLVEWNDTQRNYPEALCIHQMFETQVELTPEAIALVFEDKSLTYQSLNQRANQLAHHLQKLGVAPDVLVGVHLERSLEMVIGILGILKAGGVYVPLDPAYPRGRLAFMLDDAQISVLLTQEQLIGDLHAEQVQVVCIDSDWEMIAQESEQNTISKTTAKNLAYVIYTSGSTGVPKGVQIEHQAVVNLLHSVNQQLGLTNRDIFLGVTSLSFDICALEIFLPLIVGARLVMVSQAVASDGSQLLAHLTRSTATVMQTTPSRWRLLLAAGWRGTGRLKMLCGGEALPRKLAAQLLEKGGCLWNLYGPTETTIWSTFHEIVSQDEAIAIGRPIANTQIYLLDAQLQPVPIGVAGELHISGVGLARGYLNRPELTAQIFIPNPFSKKPSPRLYKTGDLARYHPDGTIEFLGRLDHQIKIKGYRIELKEIEAVLRDHPVVKEAIVLAREDESGSKRLVAYVVLEHELASTTMDLPSFLRQKLPDYMVPTTYVKLNALPLTPNGKLDSQSLPVPDQVQSRDEKMAQILARVKQLSQEEVKALLSKKHK